MVDEAHAAVSVGIAERFLVQPREMAWEQRCDELATAAIEAMQLHIQARRDSLAAAISIDAANATAGKVKIVYRL
jgi:hypothetical protein